MSLNRAKCRETHTTYSHGWGGARRDKVTRSHLPSSRLLPLCIPSKLLLRLIINSVVLDIFHFQGSCQVVFPLIIWQYFECCNSIDSETRNNESWAPIPSGSVTKWTWEPFTISYALRQTDKAQMAPKQSFTSRLTQVLVGLWTILSSFFWEALTTAKFLSH